MNEDLMVHCFKKSDCIAYVENRGADLGLLGWGGFKIERVSVNGEWRWGVIAYRNF